MIRKGWLLLKRELLFLLLAPTKPGGGGKETEVECTDDQVLEAKFEDVILPDGFEVVDALDEEGCKCEGFEGVDKELIDEADEVVEEKKLMIEDENKEDGRVEDQPD